jgi:hypothetical protein
LSRNHHNWNQIHKALLELGFEQVAEGDDLLVYRRDNVEVVLEKSNNIDRLLIEEICQNIVNPMMYLLKVIGIDTCVKLGDKLKTEGSGSKHVIVCDNCQKVFYFEKAFEEHKPCLAG